jgi:hypothetical protein
MPRTAKIIHESVSSGGSSREWMAAEDEDPDRGEEGVEEALAPVAVVVGLVGGPQAAPDPQIEQRLVAGVGRRVDRFGQHRAGAGEQEGDELEDREEAVADDRPDDRAALGARHGPML